MSETITPSESVRLIALERVIDKGKNTFVEVGNALSEIRDSRIYRSSHGTFEDYCRERWDWSKRSAYQFIAAAEVVENVRNCAHKPASESQARPLAKLEPEQQPAAWEKAQEIAKEEGKPVTARHVEQAVAEKTRSTTSPRMPDHIPSDGLAIGVTAKSVLGRIHANDTEREEALNAVIRYCQDRLPAPLVAAPTASPAPSLIETSESTLAQILGLLPRLRPVEITELHRVIESRWMKATSTAPATLSEAWSKTSPEDRAAFLETAHLIEKP
jgi:hypothetical protein